MRLKCSVQGRARGGASPRIAVQVAVVDMATGGPPAGFRRLAFEVPATANFEDFAYSFEVADVRNQIAGLDAAPAPAPAIDPANPPLRLDLQRRRMTRCQSDDDGDCDWEHCPQLRDGEPKKSHRHCPWDKDEGEEGGP